MSWKRRLGYSFISILVADFCCAVFLIVQSMQGRAESLFTFALAWFWVTSIFAFPGWLLALPLILGVRGASKLNLWLLGAGLVAIGPLVILIWAMVADFDWSILLFNKYALPTAIVATGFYLLLIVKCPTGNKWGGGGVSTLSG